MRSAKAGKLTNSVLMKNRRVENSSNGYIIAITLSAMVVSLVSLYSVILVMFGMLPGLIAMIIDQESKRYISKIVLTFNAAGVAPFIAKVLSSNGANSVAVDMIIDPKTWLVIYIAASVGWIVYWLFPQVGIAMNSIKTQITVQRLNFEMEKLVQEWGDDIKSK
jgi:uncharacterized membrane protein